MNTKTISIDEVIKHLKKFGEDAIEWFPPIEEQRFICFEKKYHLDLPLDYKNFLLYSNGLSLLGDEIIGFSIESKRDGLEEIYQFEHFDVDNGMPKKLIPFSPDGFGNHYCFDTQNGNIVFWEHDCDYTNNNPQIICNTFVEFLDKEVINKSLEYYDYEGNIK